MNLDYLPVKFKIKMKPIWYITGYSLTLVFCLVPALLLWFLGYVPINDEYGDLIQTYCHVDDYQIIPYICEQDCNCRTVCKRQYVDTGCSETCDTCYNTCYDVTLLLSFNVSGQSHNASVHLNDTDSYESKYPKNETIKCWYDPKQINDQGPDDMISVKVEIKSSTVFLVFFIIFLILTVGIIIGIAIAQWYCRDRPIKETSTELPAKDKVPPNHSDLPNKETKSIEETIEERIAGEGDV